MIKQPTKATPLFMKCLPALPTSNKGFTLLEMIVGMAMTLTVGAVAVTALSQAQQGFTKDKSKIEGGQKLTSVLDIIGRDILQAGEQINEARFPVVSVINDGANGSRLIVYYAPEEPLSVCKNINANTTVNDIFVASQVKATRLANPLCDVRNNPGTVAGNLPTNVQAWSNRRTAASNPTPNQLLALLHNGQGGTQSFIYSDDNAADEDDPIDDDDDDGITRQTVKIRATAFTPTIAFPIRSTVYLVEKREYLVCNKELKVRINNPVEGSCSTAGNLADSAASPFKTIASNVTKMDITVNVIDTPAATVANPNPVGVPSELAVNTNFPTVTPARTWRNLQGVTVQITSPNPESTPAIPLPDNVASGRFFPRNILSTSSN